MGDREPREPMEVIIESDRQSYICPHCGHNGYMLRIATEEVTDKVWPKSTKNLDVVTVDGHYECPECGYLVTISDPP